MQIICDNQHEYDKLMEASRYLHNYTVWVKHKKNSTKVEFQDGQKFKIKAKDIEAFGLDLSIDMVNFLAHLSNSEGIVEIADDIDPNREI